MSYIVEDFDKYEVFPDEDKIRDSYIIVEEANNTLLNLRYSLRVQSAELASARRAFGILATKAAPKIRVVSLLGYPYPEVAFVASQLPWQ